MFMNTINKTQDNVRVTTKNFQTIRNESNNLFTIDIPGKAMIFILFTEANLAKKISTAKLYFCRKIRIDF